MNGGTAATAPAGATSVLPWGDPEFDLDPYPLLSRLQERQPVCQDDDGTYLVTRYDDVTEFGKHPAMSVEPGWDAAGPWALAADTIIGRDAPDHTRLRRQTNRWFTPRVVGDWVRTTAEVTNAVLDARPDGLLDGWHELSVVPTHQTMCRVLGVPADDSDTVRVVREQMGRTMPMLAARPEQGTVEQAAAGFAYLRERVAGFVAARRAEPDDTLLASLIGAVDRGEISESEMLATATMLYGLGHMDVGYLIASGLHRFARSPDVLDLFRAEPEMRERVVNEIVRFDPPELSFYRTATAAVTIGGVHIPAGSTVRFLIAAANRDPAYFSDSHVFDPYRPVEHSRNLSFGLGSHSCAGQVISRAEARCVFEIVAARYARVELAGEVVMSNTDFSRHYEALPLRLVPQGSA